jgi:hypothetical protein
MNLRANENPLVLTMVVSAGIDPWLGIETRGQEPLHRNNFRTLENTIWMSGDPSFKCGVRHRLLIGLAKLRMWHYPGSGRFFQLIRNVLVILSKRVPTGLVMRAIFMNAKSRRLETLSEQRIRQHFPTTTFVAGFRTLRALEWALENSDFKYLVRITSTCLINEPAFIRFIETLPEERVYAGQVNDHLGSTKLFMSGAALVLSRDVVANVIAHQDEYRFDVYEDVALGLIVSEYDLADWIPMNRLDLPTTGSAESVSLDVLKNAPIIRCKAETITLTPEPVLEIFGVVANRLGWDQSGM